MQSPRNGIGTGSCRFQTVIGPTLCFVAIVGLTAATAQAQQTRQRTWAEQMFDRLNHDFGVVPKGSVAKARVKITSLWRDDTHIADVRTTCGCSAAKPEKTTLKSRESTYIEITMNTHKFTHRKNSNLIVTFDRPKRAEVRIPITAYIQPDIVINPGSVNFGTVDNSTAWKQRVKVSHSSRPNWHVQGATTNSKHLDVQVAPNPAGQRGYELTVLLKKTAPLGRFRDQVVLTTNDRQSPRVTVLVEGNVEPDIVVTPATASIGKLKPGQKKTVRVIVRGKKAIKIEKIASEAPVSVFDWIASPDGSRKVHVIPIEIKAEAKPGKIEEEFDVKIEGRPDPVRFKVYGEVAATQ